MAELTWQQLIDENLPAPTERLALRILRNADADGLAVIARADAMTWTDCATWGGVGRHLTRLRNLGWSITTNHIAIYIDTRSHGASARSHGASARSHGAPDEADDAGAQPRRVDAQPRRVDAQPRRVDAQPRRVDAQPAPPHPPMGEWVDLEDPNPEEYLHPPTLPALPATDPGASPDAAEQARTFALLVDPALGVSPAKAKALATAHPFAYVLAVIGASWSDLRSGAINAGRIVRRIEIGWGVNGRRSLDFEMSDYHRRHVAAAPAVEEPPTPPEPPGADLWRRCLDELRLQLPASTYTIWLADTRCVGVDDDCLIVVTANPHGRDWLEKRLATMVRRTLSAVAGRALDVRFEVRQNGDRNEKAADSSTGDDALRGGRGGGSFGPHNSIESISAGQP